VKAKVAFAVPFLTKAFWMEVLTRAAAGERAPQIQLRNKVIALSSSLSSQLSCIAPSREAGFRAGLKNARRSIPITEILMGDMTLGSRAIPGISYSACVFSGTIENLF
jgi:hypothetical protein